MAQPLAAIAPAPPTPTATWGQVVRPWSGDRPPTTASTATSPRIAVKVACQVVAAVRTVARAVAADCARDAAPSQSKNASVSETGAKVTGRSVFDGQYVAAISQVAPQPELPFAPAWFSMHRQRCSAT